MTKITPAKSENEIKATESSVLYDGPEGQVVAIHTNLAFKAYLGYRLGERSFDHLNEWAHENTIEQYFQAHQNMIPIVVLLPKNGSPAYLTNWIRPENRNEYYQDDRIDKNWRRRAIENNPAIKSELPPIATLKRPLEKLRAAAIKDNPDLAALITPLNENELHKTKREKLRAQIHQEIELLDLSAIPETDREKFKHTLQEIFSPGTYYLDFDHLQPQIPKELWDNKPFVAFAVKHLPTLIRFASDRIKNDKNIMRMAVSQGGHFLEHASDNLKPDLDLGLDATLTGNDNNVPWETRISSEYKSLVNDGEALTLLARGIVQWAPFMYENDRWNTPEFRTKLARENPFLRFLAQDPEMKPYQLAALERAAKEPEYAAAIQPFLYNVKELWGHKAIIGPADEALAIFKAAHPDLKPAADFGNPDTSITATGAFSSLLAREVISEHLGPIRK